MKRRHLLILAALIGIVFSFGYSEKAAAVSGSCEFKAGSCSVDGLGSIGTNDVFSGRNSEGQLAIPNSSVNSKASLISFVTSNFNPGNRNNKNSIGAALIISTMIGKNSWPTQADENEWVDRMSDGSVTYETNGNYTVTQSSWYDTSKGDVFFASRAATTRNVIIIRQNGVIKLVLQRECGNPTARLSELNRPSGWNLNPNSSVSAAQAQRGQRVTFSYSVRHTGGNGTGNPVAATGWEWRIQHKGSAGNTSVIDSNTNPPALPANELRANMGNSDARNFDIPNGAQNGDEYCRRISVRPPNNGGSGWRDSDWSCVRAVVPSTPGTVTCSVSVNTAQRNFTVTINNGLTTTLNNNNRTLTYAVASTSGSVMVPSTTITSWSAAANSNSALIPRGLPATLFTGNYSHVIGVTIAGGQSNVQCTSAFSGQEGGGCPQGRVCCPDGRQLNAGQSCAPCTPGQPNCPGTTTPPAVTLVPRAGNGGTVELGQSITFSNWVVVSNSSTANASDTFTYTVGMTSGNLSGANGGGTVSVKPDRSVPSGSQVNFTATPSASGTYCRTTSLTAYPSYASRPSGNQAQECWTVLAQPKIEPETNFEGVVEAGATAIPTARVKNNELTRQPSSSYIWRIWYSDSSSGSFASGDISIQQLNGNRQYSSAITVLTGANPVNIPYEPPRKYICTSLELTNPTPPLPITIIENNPHHTCRKIYRKPYFSVMNGDVAAVGNPHSAANKVSAFNAGGADYRGSNAQLGVFSQGPVTEFASALNSNMSKPKGLTFANSGGEAYGGNFRGIHVMPDYWSAALTHGSGNKTVDGSSANVVSNGDVFIDRDYVSFNGGSYSIGSIPVRWVIASGNIYISGDVENLDGVYIAGRNIYTCSNGFTPHNFENAAASCGRQLKVRGALIAKEDIKLLRTRGTLAQAGVPAEIIEFNPLVWMQGINAPTPVPFNGSSSGKYDFITSLPPVL